MAKRRTRSKPRPKKQTKLQKALLKRVKEDFARPAKRDYNLEYCRHVAAAKKREAELAAAKKRRNAALRGVATRKANALKAKRSAAARKGVATRKANADRRREEASQQQKSKSEPKRLTAAQVKVIENWYNNKFNPIAFKEVPTEEDVIEFAQVRGYDGFKQYRKIWDAARALFLQQMKDGSYILSGL